MIEHPTKIFPCDCMGEGLVVRVEPVSEDCIGGPFIEMGFWQFGHKPDKWSWREILKACYYNIRRKSFWTDMVVLNSKVAKNLAYHIVYLIEKEQKVKTQKPLVSIDGEDNGD